MRQDLMRQQALEEQQKEAQQQQMLLRTDCSSPISVSASSSGCQPPAQVPVEVLKVRQRGRKCEKSQKYILKKFTKKSFPDFAALYPTTQLCDGTAPLSLAPPLRCRPTWRTPPGTTSSRRSGSRYASTSLPPRPSSATRRPIRIQRGRR